jgi:uncharacterized membrane protein
MLKQAWEHLWDRQRGACIGMIGGIVLGIIYLFFGFWDMLIFGFIVYIGYRAGMRVDRGEPALPLDRTIRWLNERWRLFR